MYLQWKVGDHCLAAWSNNHMLYKASVMEVDEWRKVCKVKYDEYDGIEECPWVALCPLSSGRRLSTDDRRQRTTQKHVCIIVVTFLPLIVLKLEACP